MAKKKSADGASPYFRLFRRGRGGWTYACSIVPTSRVVRFGCDECGRGAEYPAGSFDVKLETGNAFPDILLCGAFPLLILSERAVNILERDSVNCFLKYPVGVASIAESKLKKADAPKYFRLEVTGECRTDFRRSGIKITKVCRDCGEIDRKPMVTRKLLVRDGTWDGSDLFRDRAFFPNVTFCTKKVVDLFKKHKLTNASFEKME